MINGIGILYFPIPKNKININVRINPNAPTPIQLPPSEVRMVHYLQTPSPITLKGQEYGKDHEPREERQPQAAT